MKSTDIVRLYQNGELSCYAIHEFSEIATEVIPLLPVLVDEVLRPLPGGSQSLLVRSNRGLLIVKCPYNAQGPNLLANEFLGTELMRALELPTPPWFFAQFRSLQPCPHCRTQGLKVGSSPLHFASLSLASLFGSESSTEITRSQYERIANRSDFLKAFIFDIWAGSTDQRQAVFVKLQDGWALKAFFIDHGHLFGGPDWNSPPHRGVALSRDSYIYDGIVKAEEIEAIIELMKRVLPNALPQAFSSLPAEWRYAGAYWLEQALLSRLDSLQSQVLKEIGTTFESSMRVPFGNDKRTANARATAVIPASPGLVSLDKFRPGL